MKLFVLPLVRSIKPSATTPLFYLHAQKSASNASELKNADGSLASIPISTRVTSKAEAFWAKFGEKESGWKKKVHVAGEKFMDRIEFEEWSLKAIDPAIAPKPWSELSNDADEKAYAKSGQKLERISLFYPPAFISSGPMIETLKAQLVHRGPFHKSSMIKCLLGAPFTLAFAIVPLVPNFPLFYVLWRAYSHWRAYNASQYLLALLSTSQVALKPSEVLDKIYTSAHPSSPSADPAELLLTLESVPLISKAFNFNEDDATALRRSVTQAKQRLEKELATSQPSEVETNDKEEKSS